MQRNSKILHEKIQETMTYWPRGWISKVIKILLVIAIIVGLFWFISRSWQKIQKKNLSFYDYMMVYDTDMEGCYSNDGLIHSISYNNWDMIASSIRCPLFGTFGLCTIIYDYRRLYPIIYDYQWAVGRLIGSL